MSEFAIGLGVRNPVERAETVARIFSSLVEIGADQGIQMVFVDENRLETDEGTPIGSIRDFTGRIASGAVPLLNEPAARQMAADKAHLSSIMGDDMPSTRRIGAGELVLPVLLDMEESDAFIIKPASGGRESQGVQIIKDPKAAKDLVFTQDMVAQAFVDTTHKLDTIEPIGEYYSGLWSGAQMAVPREIRMFTHRYPTGVDQYPVARISGQEHIMRDDKFVIVDPSSVPDTTYELARSALDRISEASGIEYVYGAVDMFYNSEGRPQIMEVNVKQPVMPSIKVGNEGEDDVSIAAREQAGRITRELLIKQLAALAQNGQEQ